MSRTFTASAAMSQGVCDTQFDDGVYTATGSSSETEVRHNRIVFFPSVLMHEVLPVAFASGNFADCRFAVNGWVHGDVSGARLPA